MVIDYKLTKEISAYCSLNGLDEQAYVNALLKKAFMVDKYGDRPPLYGSKGRIGPVMSEYAEEKTVDYTFTVEFPKKPVKKVTRKPKKEETQVEISENKTEAPDKKGKKRKLNAK